MDIDQDSLFQTIVAYNPWWGGKGIPDLPTWRRNAFLKLEQWSGNPLGGRALLLSGARQTGKTTLVQQLIRHLLDKGIPAQNIFYASFDHPILKLAGLDAVEAVWREQTIQDDQRLCYLFLDEVQFLPDWGAWIKRHKDFSPHWRILFTGSATGLLDGEAESAVGRWYTLRLEPLSFYEYLKIRAIDLGDAPAPLPALDALFDMSALELQALARRGSFLGAHFRDYLLRGGFPQITCIEGIAQAQRLLREDMIDKILKRDMTALFSVRKMLNLERLFIYLCLHDGGLVDLNAISGNLGQSRPTVERYIDFLEQTHLIWRLRPLGYGKEVLRGRYKAYFSDAAIPLAVLLRGREWLDANPQVMGMVVESTVLRHIHCGFADALFSYWRGGKKGWEIDMVAEWGGALIPFEVKYPASALQQKDLIGIQALCAAKSGAVACAYLITRNSVELGLVDAGLLQVGFDVPVMRIPAHLLCYWCGQLPDALSEKGGEKGGSLSS